MEFLRDLRKTYDVVFYVCFHSLFRYSISANYDEN